MSAPVRVLHVLGSLERGGVETWLLNLAARLDPARWRFDFCTLGPEPGRYASLAESCGGHVLHCPLHPRWWHFPVSLTRLLCRQRYLIVHSHVHSFSSVVLAAARAARVPVCIAHSHNTHDGRRSTLRRVFFRWLTAQLLRRTRTLGLACSAIAARALFGRDREGINIVPYGVEPNDAATPERIALRRELGLDSRAPVVGHVGRLEPQKNHEFLLEVAAALKPRRPEVEWLLVGEGSRRIFIERQIARLGLERTVRLAGQREDARLLMRWAMDVFAFPSRHEGLPLSLLESQAAGLRALASSAITPEAAVVRDAVEFLPLEAGPETWAARLAERLDAGRIPCGEAERQIRAAGMTLDHSLERLLAIYQEALER